MPKNFRLPGSSALATGAPFNNVYLKPFPVRAALEIGTGSQITLVVARVDARQRAIRDVLLQTQAAVHIEFLSGTRQLTDRSRGDIINKTRLVMGALRRNEFGVSEVAGLLTWPFAECEMTQELLHNLRAEFKIDFRLFGDHLRPPEVRRTPLLDSSAKKVGEDSVSEGAPPTSHGNSEQLAFLAYAAAAKVRDQHRMLAVLETPDEICLREGSEQVYIGGAIDIVGTVQDTDKTQVSQREKEKKEETFECEPNVELPQEKFANNCLEDFSGEEEPLELQRYRLPLTTLDAHMMLLRDVQRRTPALLHAFSSPNPVLRAQAARLRSGLIKLISPTVPRWLKEKVADGAVLLGAAENGGLLNIGSRLTGVTNFGLEPLVQATDYIACGQTDALLGYSYPNPHLVVAQGALCGALMGALTVSRIEYLPQVSLAHAVLVHPAFWAFSRRRSIQERLAVDPWWQDQAKRSFDVPNQARATLTPNLPPGYFNSKMQRVTIHRQSF